MDIVPLLDFLARRGMSVNLLLGEERVAELRTKAEKSFEVVIHNPRALRRLLEELLQ